MDNSAFSVKLDKLLERKFKALSQDISCEINVQVKHEFSVLEKRITALEDCSCVFGKRLRVTEGRLGIPRVRDSDEPLLLKPVMDTPLLARKGRGIKVLPNQRLIPVDPKPTTTFTQERRLDKSTPKVTTSATSLMGKAESQKKPTTDQIVTNKIPPKLIFQRNIAKGNIPSPKKTEKPKATQVRFDTPDGIKNIVDKTQISEINNQDLVLKKDQRRSNLKPPTKVMLEINENKSTNGKKNSGGSKFTFHPKTGSSVVKDNKSISQKGVIILPARTDTPTDTKQEPSTGSAGKCVITMTTTTNTTTTTISGIMSSRSSKNQIAIRSDQLDQKVDQLSSKSEHAEAQYVIKGDDMKKGGMSVQLEDGGPHRKKLDLKETIDINNVSETPEFSKKYVKSVNANLLQETSKTIRTDLVVKQTDALSDSIASISESNTRVTKSEDNLKNPEIKQQQRSSLSEEATVKTTSSTDSAYIPKKTNVQAMENSSRKNNLSANTDNPNKTSVKQMIEAFKNKNGSAAKQKVNNNSQLPKRKVVVSKGSISPPQGTSIINGTTSLPGIAAPNITSGNRTSYAARDPDGPQRIPTISSRLRQLQASTKNIQPPKKYDVNVCYVPWEKYGSLLVDGLLEQKLQSNIPNKTTLFSEKFDFSYSKLPTDNMFPPWMYNKVEPIHSKKMLGEAKSESGKDYKLLLLEALGKLLQCTTSLKMLSDNLRRLRRTKVK